MSEAILVTVSQDLSDAVAAIAPSVVQVHGRRRPASGVVFAPGVVLTTMRAIGREEDLHVRTPDGRTLDAELAGWDPATHLAVLRAAGLNAPAATPADVAARVGHVALAVGRSWSNALTASAGIVAVIGGPLPTGRKRAIEQVIRITAPMHEGFAGGACVDASGRPIGIATAATIRGFGVVIPAAIAWKAAGEVLAHGRPTRGYLGVGAQAVRLATHQRPMDARDGALLISGISAGSPAESAGLLIGDLITDFDGQPVESPEDLLEALVGDRVGRQVVVRILRGGEPRDVTITVVERPRT